MWNKDNWTIKNFWKKTAIVAIIFATLTMGSKILFARLYNPGGSLGGGVTVPTVLYSGSYAGADVFAQVNAAYASSDCPSTGCTVLIPGGTNSVSTPLVCGTNLKFLTIKGPGAASAIYKWTPTSGTAITINCGNPTGHLGYEVTGFTLQGSASLIAAGNTNTNTSVGIFYGGTNGAVGVHTHDFNINGFGTNWQIGANAYMLTFSDFTNSGGNGGQASAGALLTVNAASNSGERNVFTNGVFTDPGNSTATNCIYITNAGTASNFFSNISIDDCQVRTGTSNGINNWDKIHVENAAFGTYGAYVPFVSPSSDLSTLLSFTNIVIANDTSGANSFATIFSVGGPVSVENISIQNYGGGTITNLVDHSTDNGVSHDHVCQVQVQGGALTNIIAGGGGVTYSRATGGGCVDNTDNSFTIGMRAIASNTNEFFSGNTVVGTFDHNGNWVLGNSGQNVSQTLQHLFFPTTMTATGTTGAQTINKASGSVNIAAAGTSVVVTDNYVATTSIVYVVVRTNDTTCALKNVVPASGSFTITTTAACTAETSFGFIVVN